MRPRYKVSPAGVELIERFEGFRARAARLPDGGWTIGFGHTRSAREGAEVSREDAGILLKYFDLPPVEDAIHELVFAPLSQPQYDALVAFVFNIGPEAFAASDVLKRLNEGRPTEAACALELWRRAEVAGDPVVLDALIRRRAAEKALFLTLPEGVVPTPSPLVRPELDVRAAEGLPKRRPVEHEAPLGGEAAEVRLVAPFEVEPPLEAPAAVTPEPADSLVAEAAAEAQEEAQPEAPTAWTTQVISFAVQAEAPAAWSAQAEPAAETRVEEAQVEEGLAEAAAAEEAPTAWTVEPEAPVEAAPEATPTAFAPEPEAPVVEAASGRAAEEAPTAWTVEPEPAPEAEPAVVPEPAAPRFSVLPGPPTRAIPAVETSAVRPVYSNYGPMAFAVRPPELRISEPATAPESEGEGGEEAADSEPHPAPVAPVSTAASEAQVLAEVVAAPAVTAEAQPPQPLVLTAPPADWEEQRGASPAMITALAAEADELETPLFDEGWDGPSALSGRIVRHEAVSEPERRRKPAGATAPYVLLGLVGFVAFAGALFAFWRGRAPGASGNPTVLAWSLVLIGAACVGISVYFLLKRLGGAED